MWLSLVERLTGGQEVVGSNPAIPMRKKQIGGIAHFKLSLLFAFIVSLQN